VPGNSLDKLRHTRSVAYSVADRHTTYCAKVDAILITAIRLVLRRLPLCSVPRDCQTIIAHCQWGITRVRLPVAGRRYTTLPFCRMNIIKLLTRNTTGKTTVSVLHDAQLLLNKQQQIWGSVCVHRHFLSNTDTIVLRYHVYRVNVYNPQY